MGRPFPKSECSSFPVFLIKSACISLFPACVSVRTACSLEKLSWRLVPQHPVNYKPVYRHVGSRITEWGEFNCFQIFVFLKQGFIV